MNEGLAEWLLDMFAGAGFALGGVAALLAVLFALVAFSDAVMQIPALMAP